ncbi:hypothetical protein D3C77_531710 [compost metagenome]
MIALDADFIAHAFHGVERLVVRIGYPRGLRVEDLGVAGVQGPGLVEVVDRTGVRDENAGLLAIDLGGSPAVRTVFGVALPVDHPAAEDQVQVISQVQA